MPAGPPPPAAGYYRPADHLYGSPEQLEALGKAFFGVGWVFVAAIGLALVSIAIAVVSQTPLLFWVCSLLSLIPLFLLIRTYAAAFVFGKGKPESDVMSTTILWTVLVGLVGIIGLAVIQMFISEELKKYGLSAGLFSMISRKKVAQRVEELRAQRAAQTGY